MLGIQRTAWHRMNRLTIARLIWVLITSLLEAALWSRLFFRILNREDTEDTEDTTSVPAVDLNIEDQEQQQWAHSINYQVAVGKVILTRTILEIFNYIFKKLIKSFNW